MMDRESEEQPGRRVGDEGQWLESNSSESLGKQDQRWPTATGQASVLCGPEEKKERCESTAGQASRALMAVFFLPVS